MSNCIPEFGKDIPTTCGWSKDCSKVAAWCPDIRIFPKGHPMHGPLNMIMNIGICEGCTGKIAPENFMVEETWVMIEKVLEANGKVPPDRARTQIGFQLRTCGLAST